MIHFCVVTVVKNDLAGLRKTRTSLNQQQFKNWTHLIIDGSSKDGTLKYIESLPQKNTIYISESDTGIYNAMNKAWKLSDPESYMFYLNARDIFTDPTSLSEAAKALKLFPGSNWGCTTHEEINEDGTGWVCKLVSPPSVSNQLHAYGYRSHQAVVMKASFIQSLGGFNETYKIASDWDLIARAIKADAPVVWIHPIARFELGGMSSKHLLEAHMELREIRKIHLGKNLKSRTLDAVWCHIYLRYFGYKNLITYVLNFSSFFNHAKQNTFNLSGSKKLIIDLFWFELSLNKKRKILRTNNDRQNKSKSNKRHKFTLMLNSRLKILPYEMPIHKIEKNFQAHSRT
jgi:glycosyltransferase involved in cell wall biosynthesis